eukprot:TRINITY_DN24609_c0_g2_i1.p1 TRINITY_DN24609_c0_g2~~TRINITY_DN24609_c0_g2_i1.p1  ORF type:complete len:732 (-),score=89.46 TRINITY_DN24609_c0_g2_i1:421-2616(-)
MAAGHSWHRSISRLLVVILLNKLLLQAGASPTKHEQFLLSRPWDGATSSTTTLATSTTAAPTTTTTTTSELLTLSPPTIQTLLQPGLVGELFNFETKKSTIATIDKTVHHWGKLYNPLAMKWRGRLYIRSTGTYSFSITSTGASELSLDSVEILRAAEPKPGFNSTTSFKRVFLPAGYHAILLGFTETSGYAGFSLHYMGPDTAEQLKLVPSHAFFHEKGPCDLRPLRGLARNACAGPRWALGSGESCEVQCSYGRFADGHPDVRSSWLSCTAGELSEPNFACTELRCSAPKVENASAASCQEGSFLASGGKCTPVCNPGFQAQSWGKLRCHNGTLMGSFLCNPKQSCTAPTTVKVPNMLGCRIGQTVPHGSHCEPLCMPGFKPSLDPVCNDGTFKPKDFGCVPIPTTTPAVVVPAPALLPHAEVEPSASPALDEPASDSQIQKILSPVEKKIQALAGTYQGGPGWWASWILLALPLLLGFFCIRKWLAVSQGTPKSRTARMDSSDLESYASDARSTRSYISDEEDEPPSPLPSQQVQVRSLVAADGRIKLPEFDREDPGQPMLPKPSQGSFSSTGSCSSSSSPRSQYSRGSKGSRGQRKDQDQRQPARQQSQQQRPPAQSQSEAQSQLQQPWQQQEELPPSSTAQQQSQLPSSTSMSSSGHRERIMNSSYMHKPSAHKSLHGGRAPKSASSFNNEPRYSEDVHGGWSDVRPSGHHHQASHVPWSDVRINE